MLQSAHIKRVSVSRVSVPILPSSRLMPARNAVKLWRTFVMSTTSNQFESHTQPSESGRQCNLISVHGHIAAGLHSNGNLTVWTSQISREWRECSIMTLATIHWVLVQVKGSKILCVKKGAMKITPRDRIHQEYLTINIWSTSDWGQLQLRLVRLC